MRCVLCSHYFCNRTLICSITLFFCRGYTFCCFVPAWVSVFEHFKTPADLTSNDLWLLVKHLKFNLALYVTSRTGSTRRARRTLCKEWLFCVCIFLNYNEYSFFHDHLVCQCDLSAQNLYWMSTANATKKTKTKHKNVLKQQQKHSAKTCFLHP